MKIFILLATTVIATVILGGCATMNIFTQSDESVRDEILEHLYQKYGVAFTAISLDRGLADRLTAFPSGGDPDADIVRAQRSRRDGNVEFHDTFFGILIREDFEAEIVSTLSPINLPMKVFFTSDITSFDNRFDGTKNFEDLKQWISEGNTLRFLVVIMLSMENLDETEVEEYAKHVFEILEETSFAGLVHVRFIPSEEFSSVTRFNRNKVVQQLGNRTIIFSKSIN